MRLFQPLFALFATASDTQLACMIEYLKAENRILREKLPRRITVTPRERARLLKLGSKLGSAIRDLVTIVSARTFARWKAAVDPMQTSSRRKVSTRKPGRPRTPEDIRKLVIWIAT